MTQNVKDVKRFRVLQESRQRRLAMVTLVLFFSIKGYLWSNYNVKNLDYALMLTLFTALNLAWVTGIKYFKIPRLDSNLLIFLIFMTLSLLDMTITQKIDSRSKKSKNLTSETQSTGNITREQDEWHQIFGDDYMKGKHYVNIIAPSKAEFVEEPLQCISENKSFVDLKIWTNSPPPMKIKALFNGLDGKIEEKNFLLPNSNIVKDDTQKVDKDSYLYTIRAYEPGVYKVESIYEENRGYNPTINKGNIALVGICPRMSISIPEGQVIAKNSEAINTCIGRRVDFNIIAHGTPPLNIEYLKVIDDDKIMVPTVVGESAKLPSNIIQAYSEEFNGDQDAVLRALVNTLKEEKMVVPLSIFLDEPASYHIQLLRIKDSRNNTILYDTESDVTSLDYSPDMKTSMWADRYGDYISIKAYLPPTAEFLDCDKPKIYYDDYDEELNLQIYLKGLPPWNVTYSLAKNEQQANDSKFLFTNKIENIRHDVLKIPIKSPGQYVLQLVTDSNCSGVLTTNSTCMVDLSTPPTLNVTANPIIHQCYGATGTTLNLSLFGEPPFHVFYEEKHIESDTKKHHELVIKRNLKTLILEPKNHGTYNYTFYRISDSIFKKGVDIEPVTFTQEVHISSTASLKASRTAVCPGEVVEVDIILNGQAPWTIHYSISKGSFMENRVIRDVKSSTTVRIDVLNNPGIYNVDLTSVSDGNNCKGTIEVESIPIEVSTGSPIAYFKSSSEEHIIEGQKKDLQILTKGGGNFTLEVVNEADEPTIVRGNKVLTFTAKKPGMYRITKVENSYCKGSPGSFNEIKVLPVPYPTVSLGQTEIVETKSEEDALVYVKPEICKGIPDRVSLGLTGKPAFVVRYSHKLTPLQESEIQMQERSNLDSESFEMSKSIFFEKSQNKTEIASDNHELETLYETLYMPLFTDVSGIHRYKILHPSDRNYPVNSNRVNTLPAFYIEQTVLDKPNAAFLDKEGRTYQCIFNEYKTFLLIEFKGVPPFNFVLKSQHDDSPARYENLVSEGYIYEYQPQLPNAIGMYKYSIQFVKDSKGCESVIDQTLRGSSVSRNIVDIARITPVTPYKEVCRGDVLTFVLEGTAPYTIHYKIDDEEMETVSVRESLLTLCALRSGTLKITKICNNLGCCSEPNPEVSILVRDFPSVSSRTDTSNSVEIHEGETAKIVYTFTGVPPFSFRYIVTPLSNSKVAEDENNVIKTVLVTDINDYTKEIETTTKGVYVPVMVSDMYCQYPPKSKISSCQEANNVISH